MREGATKGCLNLVQRMKVLGKQVEHRDSGIIWNSHSNGCLNFKEA